MPTPTFLVEMKLTVNLVDQTGAYLVDENGHYLVADGWIDVTSDVLISSSPTWTRGNSGRTIFDRVSNVGTFSFSLKNSIANAAATAGYYSPDHANVALRFGLDTEVRVSLIDGATTSEEWQGIIKGIYPDAGVLGERSTAIVCEDWMATTERDTVSGITVQTNKRDDELLTTLLALSSSQPLATDFSVGDDTYTYSLHDENSITSSLARVFQKIAMSGFGRIYLVGFGTLTYRSRSDLLLVSSPEATITDDMSGLQVSRTKEQRVRRVLATTYPSEIDGSDVVLWESQREIELGASETMTFEISFRDPSGRATRVSALNLAAAVANTDYKFSSVSGSGTDLNANLTVSYELKADQATVTLTSTYGATGYLWFFQTRGIGVYLYEPVTSPTDTGQPDGEILDIDMVYQDDATVGNDISNLVAYWYVVDVSDVESVTFIGNRNQDLMDAALLPVGSLVSIAETQTGISNQFFINGFSKTMGAGNVLTVTWYLTSANQIAGVCRLDVVGLAELDDTAILGA